MLVLFCVMQLSAQVPSNALLKVFDSVCRQSTPGKNFMFSPWGIQQCFGMAAEGAGKVSSKELEQILGISKDSAEKFHLAAQSLKNTQARFNSFNAILFDRKYTLQKDFIDRTVKYYNGKLYKVDLSRKAECAKLLNSIIRRESYNLFYNVFTPQTLAGDPVMVLLNVLYFKDNWQTRFDKEATRLEKFFIMADKNAAPQQIKTDMMNCCRRVPYYNDGNIHGVVLNYQDSRFKMLVLTGIKKNTPLENITHALADKGFDHFDRNANSFNKTFIKLPKLELTSDLDLVELLTGQGMKTTFSPQLGDLNGMVMNKQLYIAKSRQLVKLKLDEQSTEAAVVTYAIPEVTSAPPQEEEKFNYFYADHPFVLVLFDSQTQAVLLTAAVNAPPRKN